MKKYILVFMLVLGAGLAACAGGEPAQEPAAAETPTEAVEQPQEAEEVSEAPTEAETEAPAEAETAAPAEVETAAPAEETPETESATEAPAEGTAEQAGAIRIGVLNPTTGGLAVFGEQVNTGIELYFNSIDQTVGETPVELLFADTAGEPQQALDQARRLVEQENVDFLTGIVNSAVVVPLAQFADEQQIPLLIMVGGAQVATGPDRSPYVFRTAMANGQQDRPLGWYTASELGLTNAATFAWDFLVGEERAGSFADTFTAAGGTIVTEQKPPLGTTDYGPFISQVDPASIDVVYAFFAGPGAISFVQQMREFGLAPELQTVASGYFTAGVLEAMGQDAIGLVQASQYVPGLDNSENMKFLELFSAEGSGEPGVYVEEGYLGAMVAARAIEAAGGDLSDPQRFLDALANLEFEGPSGPFHFGENGQSVRNVYITRVVETDDGGITQEIIDVIEDVSQDWTPQ